MGPLPPWLRLIGALALGFGLSLPVAAAGSPPQAVAAGPYFIVAGADLTLAGAAVDPEGGPLVATWDLNGDGQYGDAEGVAVTVPWSALDLLDPPLLRNSPFTIRLRVTDDEDLVAVAASILTVVNPYPQACFTFSAPEVPAGAAVTANANCSWEPDPRRSIVSYEWFWADHQSPDAAGAVVSLVPPYEPGSGVLDLPLRMRATNDAGGAADVVHAVHVVPPIDGSTLRSPAVLEAAAESNTPAAFAQVWIDGVTDPPGPAAGLQGQIGFGPDGSDPAVDAGWLWVEASWFRNDGAHDEYIGTLPVTGPGRYDYCFRFSFPGWPWTYADVDGSGNGYAPSQAGSLVVHSPSDVPHPAVTRVRLHPNRPNPFNPETVFAYELPAAAEVDLGIYDPRGRLVRTLVAHEFRGPGRHEARWRGCDESGKPVAAGVYLYQLRVGSFQDTRRMVLVK